MSKEYARKTPKEYSLPPSLYLRVLHTVRDYPRMCETVNDILYSGGGTPFTEYIDKKNKLCRAVLPRVNGISKSTEDKAFKIEQNQETINAIDNALKKIPIEYRQYVFDNVVYKTAYPFNYAHRNTWSMWRMRFLYFVAEELELL